MLSIVQVISLCTHAHVYTYVCECMYVRSLSKGKYVNIRGRVSGDYVYIHTHICMCTLEMHQETQLS